MPLRKSRFFVRLADLCAWTIFFIPVFIERRRQKEVLEKPRRILLVELWGIGDLVMMSGILKPLKSHFPDAKISLICKPVSGELFTNYNYIDEMLFFDFPWTKFRGKYKVWEWDWKGILRLIVKLRRASFDLAIDARGDLRNNLLLFLSGVKRRIGYACLGGGFFLTHQIRSTEKLHRVDKWAGILSFLGVKDIIRPRIELDKKEIEWADNFLNEKKLFEKDLLVGIHPGAANNIRRWPYERFIEVANYLKKAYGAGVLFFPMAGVGLRQMAALLSRTDFLICNDSGPMHIATAVDTSVIAIFGPGDKEAIGPYGDKHRVVLKADITCRPCFDYCKYKTHFCINAIKIEDVIAAADEMIEKFSLK